MQWLTQQLTDMTCTAVYVGDSEPIPGLDTAGDEGTKVAAFTIYENDDNVLNYSIDDNGKLYYKGVRIADPDGAGNAIVLAFAQNPSILISDKQTLLSYSHLLDKYALAPANVQYAWSVIKSQFSPLAVSTVENICADFGLPLV